MHLIERLGYGLLLKLPEGLRKRLFAESDLSADCKLVLATLYYLDSKRALSEYVRELPRQTCLEWRVCQECLGTLARMGLIEYTEAGVRLKVKPLT